MIQQIKERLARLLKDNRAVFYTVVLGAAGLLLIALSGLFGSEGKAPEASAFSAEQYTERLEERLCDIVGGIAGAGDCRVMVTLENGVEYLYATEQKNGSSHSEKTDGDISQQSNSQASVILVETDAGKQGLLVTEIQPTVKGVAVICQGGEDPRVQQRIVQAISTVLDISASRVCVTKMS